MHRRSATRCAMTASVKPPLAAAAASAVVEAATWSGTETLRASGVSTQKGLTSAAVTRALVPQRPELGCYQARLACTRAPADVIAADHSEVARNPPSWRT